MKIIYSVELLTGRRMQGRELDWPRYASPNLVYISDTR